MNFNHLFTAARVLRASYQIASTVVLFYYMLKRPRLGRRPYRDFE